MVYNKLSNLQSDKAAGLDNLLPRVLKEAAAVFCIPLTVIFTKSLSEGSLSVDWKLANII